MSQSAFISLQTHSRMKNYLENFCKNTPLSAWYSVIECDKLCEYHLDTIAISKPE